MTVAHEIPISNNGLRVLIVDDTRLNLKVLEAMITKMGHVPVLASSGEEALALFQQQPPDIVLMDVLMPEMDGYETVRQLRQRSDKWVPVIFISAMTDAQDMVTAIQSGGDDYLFKPINYDVLRVKIGLFNDRVQLAHKLEEQHRILLDNVARTEEEQQTAKEFMRKLTALDEINDPAVRFYLQAAENFSGDLIAVARTPSNHLYLMLADSTGHGLTASLAVTPVLQPFHAMSKKGFSISAIAAEINRKVTNYLPIHRFVAATLVALDWSNRTISVWNGGCPPVVVLDEFGASAWKFHSNHVPLGILSELAFDAKLEHYPMPETYNFHIFMCSDGTIDLIDHSDMRNGMEVLLGAGQASKRNERFPQMIDFLMQKQNGQAALDDIALIMVDGLASATQTAVSTESIPLAPVVIREVSHEDIEEIEWRFSLSLTATHLQRLDVVPILLNLVNQIEEEDGKKSNQLYIVLSELFNNALDHGLLELDSSLKHDIEGIEHYYKERSERLGMLTEGEIGIVIKRSRQPNGILIIEVKDSGKGFDYAKVIDSGNALDQRHGRGITLIQNIVSNLIYKGNGSEVVVQF